MFGVMLQDWTTVHVTGTAGTVKQSEPTWVDVGDYRDIVLWLETRGVLIPALQSVQLYYETSPTKDDGLFSTLASQASLAANTRYIDKVLEASNPSVPLSKWVRWRLAVTGSPSTEWGATFRIHCSLNANRSR